MFKVFFEETSFREFGKLEKSIKNQIKKKVRKLEKKPELGKPLRNSNFWSLRVGNYRVIYEIIRESKKIIILAVKHRKNVYTDFDKLLFLFFY